MKLKKLASNADLIRGEKAFRTFTDDSQHSPISDITGNQT